MTEKLLSPAFAGVVIAIVAILVIPLPPIVLDALLAVNILVSAIVLLTSIRVEEPLEFSSFAPALLLATLFRLALDVSATRLILTQGHLPDGVGEIVPAFGAFVVRGNLVVGLIIFAILIAIQFIVIASGSQRVAEVCARFTLDAMPGKQMAIDAEVHAGTLDPDTARVKRTRVQREADFYAAMDGAGKFVKGDAVAALVITALNLAGGVAVGALYHGMSPGDAVNTFALLSIGNALVTTLPAFLISLAMGMMVTRVAGTGALGADLAAQLLARPDVLRAAGVLVCGLAFVPALPMPLFLALGVAAFGAAQIAARRRAAGAAAREAAHAQARTAAIRRPETALALVGVDAFAIDVGSELFPLLAAPNADALLDRIGDVRRALASEIGIVLPGVRLRDDPQRVPSTYAIRVRDEIAGEGVLRLDKLVAVADPAVLGRIAGEETREPVYGLRAVWIAPEEREAVEALGALAFDAVSIIGSHVAEIARERAADLLGRQELQTLVEHVRVASPALVKDIGTDVLPLPTLHRAFLMLLRERAWPRDAHRALEAMVDAAHHTREPRELAEAARRAIVPGLLRRAGSTQVRALLVAPRFEETLVRALGGGGAPDPHLAILVRDRIAAYAAEGRPALVCTSTLRPMLADLLERFAIRADVYAYTEIPAEIAVVPVGTIEDQAETPAASAQAAQRPVMTSAASTFV